MSGLSKVEREIARHKAAGQLTNEEIGRRVKRHRNSVSRILQREMVQSAIEELRRVRVDSLPKNAHDALDAIVPIAIASLAELAAHARSEKTRLAASRLILEYATNSPTHRIEIEDIPYCDIEEGNRQALEVAQACGGGEIGLYPPGVSRLVVRHRDGDEIITQYIGDDGHQVAMNFVQVDADGRLEAPQCQLQPQPPVVTPEEASDCRTRPDALD